MPDPDRGPKIPEVQGELGQASDVSTSNNRRPALQHGPRFCLTQRGRYLGLVNVVGSSRSAAEVQLEQRANQ